MDTKKNFAYSTVLTAPSPAGSGTSLTLASGGGALMPATPFDGVVWPAGAQPVSSNAEIVRVTGLAGDVATIVRQRQGTSARTIVVGDQFAAAINAKDLGEPIAVDTPAEDVFVPAGETLMVGDEMDLTTGGSGVELDVEGEVAFS